MKKVSLLISLCFIISLSSFAATVIIQVVNFQFNPANATVQVGDIVRFHFSVGYHNATSIQDVIPAGAVAINSGDPDAAVRDYDYDVSVPGEYNYYCEVHGGPGGNGMAGKFTASGSLPLTLSGFSIQAQANKSALLLWSTETEQNVQYFSIWRSTNGVHFNEIAKVTAMGNSTSVQQYQFTDKSLSQSHRYVFYQLLIVDRDGKETYSAIKQFKTAFATANLLVTMSPNPIKKPGQLMLQFNAEKAGWMPVNVYSVNGKLVLKTSMQAMPGLNNGHIHVCDLPAGIYTLQFSYEGLRESRKLLVQ